MRPQVVALVGPAGSGKSLVRESLARLGAAVLDFDDYSRELLQPGTEEYRRLRTEFGPDYFRPDGSVDRAALGELAFGDAAARARLNAIVHPGMLARLRTAIADFRRRPRAPVLAVEGAILPSLPARDWFDRVVLVTAPAALREQRVREARRFSPETARALMRLQEEMGLENAAADQVIHNDGDRRALEAAVQDLWDTLTGPGTPVQS